MTEPVKRNRSENESDAAESPTAPQPAPAAPARWSGAARFFLMTTAFEEAAATELTAGRPGYPEFLQAKQLARDAIRALDRGASDLSALLLLVSSIRHGARALARHRGQPVESAWKVALGEESVRREWERSSVAVRRDTEQLITPAETQDDQLTASPLRDHRIAANRVAFALLAVLERCRVRTRRLLVIRAIRIGTAVVLTLFIGLVTWSRIAPRNLARNATVTVSSNNAKHGVPVTGAVDGVRDKYGFHTDRESNPWVQLDLGRARLIRRVVVYNREGPNTSRAVPLVVETSDDGQQWEPFAERGEDFHRWVATGQAAVRTRYVRLTARRKSTFLHLAEIEVY